MDGNSDERTTHWLDQLANGQESLAQQQLFNKYFERVKALARRRLQRHEDAEDVALSVLKSFFMRANDEQFHTVSSGDELWALLCTIATRKIIDHRRREFAQVRDQRRNMPLDSIPEEEFIDQVVAGAIEESEELLAAIADPPLRQVAELRLAGHTNREIAEHIERTIKLVEYRMKKIREILLRKLSSE